ncbi:MAG TPA: carbohydrate-binding protein [Polyangia bacterium]|nr:carbohydrate-binding protein [Polyangia bacterium]
MKARLAVAWPELAALAALALLGLPACGDTASAAAELGAATTTTTATTIWIDASQQTAAPPHFWSASVGTGTASLTLRGDLESHYKIGHREAGFQRVRGHGVLSDDMGIYQGPGAYDWTKLDRYLTAIDAAGMRPIMEMDFMPTALALRGSSRDIYQSPADYRSFIAAVVQHCVDRFGSADVSQWYWEIWNEPDFVGFWNGRDASGPAGLRMLDYYALYDAAAAAITSVLPEALVGGPASTNPAPIGGFLQHCRRAGARVTFVSSHHYPGGAGDGTADAASLVDDDASRRQAIAGAGYAPSQLLSFATEWSSSYAGQGGGTGDALLSMDNHWNVGFILEAAKLFADQAASGVPPPTVFSYWALSDVFGEHDGDAGSYIQSQGGTLPFGRVFGLITYQGLRKASFNAFKMLNRLGPMRLRATGGASADGVGAMATMSEAGDEIQVLLYDQYGKLDTTGTDTVTVDLYNLPPALAGRRVVVTRFIVDATHSNPYAVWEAEGSPADPSEAQWEALRAAQHLSAQPVETTTVDTSYGTSFVMSRQSGSLLVIGLERPVMGRDARAPIEGEDHDGRSGASNVDATDADLGQAAAVTAGGSLFYDVVDFGDAGVDSVQLRVQAPAATTIELRADAASGPRIGACAIAATESAWTTATCPLSHTSGVHTLYLLFAAPATLNWLQFQAG